MSLLGSFKSVVKTVIPSEWAQRIQFEKSLLKTDVFLVGHPKSGNTWLAYMLAVFVNEDRAGRINIGNIGEFAPTVHGRDWDIGSWMDLARPRIFRSEAAIFPGRYPRTVYIVRDPRAVLVSYYHHCVHDTGRAQWRMTDFVDEMLAEGRIAGLEPSLIRWDRQVEEWLARSKRQPVALVRYEDLKNDPATVLRGLIEFMGLRVDEELLHHVIFRGDFKSMRKEERLYGAESFPGEKGSNGFFVRKGEVDGWKSELPAESRARIEAVFSGTMQKLAYLPS